MTKTRNHKAIKAIDEAIQALTEETFTLEDRVILLRKAQEIGERHHATEDETIRDVFSRAAAAGDQEAQAILACGLLD